MGPILVKKILRRGSHFTKIAKKIVKSGIFVLEKPLEMSPYLQKSAAFEGEKWVGVSEIGPHTPSKNNLSTCHQHGLQNQPLGNMNDCL